MTIDNWRGESLVCNNTLSVHAQESQNLERQVANRLRGALDGFARIAFSKRDPKIFTRTFEETVLLALRLEEFRIMRLLSIGGEVIEKRCDVLVVCIRLEA